MAQGENICYEVIKVCEAAGLAGDDRIFRARFSALTETHIKTAWQRPGKPDSRLALAVDARQVTRMFLFCEWLIFFARVLLVGALAVDARLVTRILFL